jgi:hypothetical protein
LGSLLLITLAIACLIVAIRRVDEWGVGPTAAVCVTTGALLGLIELRRSGGFGTLRGRLFRAAIGGMGGGGVFVVLTTTLEWIAMGQQPAAWSALALRLGTWLLWGGLAGGMLGAVVDVCRAPRRPPLPARGDQRAAEFLAALPGNTPPDDTLRDNTLRDNGDTPGA